MKIKDIEELGKLLFCERWQSPLARALKVNDRTVRAWMEGRFKISSGVINDLIDLAAKKQLEGVIPIISDMAKKIDKIPQVELKLYEDDNNIVTVHKRTWSYETDKMIKERMAEILNKEGIVTVVKII